MHWFLYLQVIDPCAAMSLCTAAGGGGGGGGAAGITREADPEQVVTCHTLCHILHSSSSLLSQSVVSCLSD